MYPNLSIFAGPICINPTTERESFVWSLVIGVFLLGFLSIIFGLAVLIVKARRTLHAKRVRWIKGYIYSLLTFFGLLGLGWLTATGGTGDDYCRTAESSPQGSALFAMALLAGLAAFCSLIGFIFSFQKKS